MIKEVNTVDDLNEFFFQRTGTLLLKEKVMMTFNEDGHIAKRVICKPVIVEIGEKSHTGFVITADSVKSWITFELSAYNLLITDDYIAIITEFEETVSITKYSLKPAEPDMLDRFNVRMTLNCSVGDGNYLAAVKKLNEEEVLYCLEHETRKTGIRNLKSQARRLGMEV